MTYTTRAQQPPVRCSLPHLKRIAAAPDEQAIAQTELNQHIADQAQAIALEPLTTVEINFYHHEVYAGKQLIAYITYDHDEFVTQPWLVMVNGVEKFRATTPARCQRFIEWHHQDGTLRETFPAPLEVEEAPTILEISFYDQEAFVGDKLVASISYDHGNYQNLYWRVLVNDVEIFRDTTPARCHSYVKQQYQQGTLPVQEPFDELCTTENRIMAHIFNECQKYGFEILDDGIYKNGIKLGQVGYTDRNWWVKRDCSAQQQYSDSVFDAVESLLMVSELSDAEIDECEKLLDIPFEELTAQEWQQLQAYEPLPELELLAA